MTPAEWAERREVWRNDLRLVFRLLSDMLNDDHLERHPHRFPRPPADRAHTWQQKRALAREAARVPQ